jgi:hypothetical protein
MIILRNKYTLELGRKATKGMRKKQIKFLDSNLKSVNEWIKPGHYNSPKVVESKEATLKRIGRAESTKLSDKEFIKEIQKLNK